jgi:CMP-N-acetylneuraminic acid synthetase
MEPLMPGWHDQYAPRHSMPTQVLDPVYVQNASLEMAWCWVLDQTRTISGTTVCPFLTDEIEGFDINTEQDWQEAERLAERYLPHA